jgi:excisionase family DNA binding protein
MGRESRSYARSALDPLLTVDEAGDLLGPGPRFPRRLIAERRIRFVKVGRHVRIPESALVEFITAGTVEPSRRSGEWRWPA